MHPNFSAGPREKVFMKAKGISLWQFCPTAAGGFPARRPAGKGGNFQNLKSQFYHESPMPDL
jgi:hypothetical protein